MRYRLLALLMSLSLTGCWIARVEVQNPIPDMTVIAIAPFFNLSQEPSEVVDGRRFALAYFAELQKTQGFQVIPLGVVETTILEHQINLNDKQDVLRLANLLGADAVVIGAVTDYDPYYPPRIGLQVDWYSPQVWEVDDAGAGSGVGGATGGGMRGTGGKFGKMRKGRWCDLGGQLPGMMRGQSPDLVELESPEEFSDSADLDEKRDLSFSNGVAARPSTTMRANGPLQIAAAQPESALAVEPAPGANPAAAAVDLTEPLMSYTRLFDGADADLVHKLRDYLELRGDKRSGSWEAHLHRTEDFIRFSSHLMIVEMLAQHGGAVRTQFVLKWRKYR